MCSRLLRQKTRKPGIYPKRDRRGPVLELGERAEGSGTLRSSEITHVANPKFNSKIRPGLAVCYGGIPHAFDMRTTQMIFAGPEQALMAVAMTQLGKRYRLPVYINVGLTDSKLPDAQAGMESGMTLLCGALAGADIFGHLGICGVDQASSLTMLLMQHEIIGYVEHFLRGFEIDDETLGLDTIRQVGHDGSFISEEHTVRHFRDELWFPQLLDREFWDNWMEAGGSDMHQRCIAEKEKILSSHEPEPLDEETTREVDKIVAAARKHLS